jgi:GT2 family glycosyltransferase
MMEEIKPGITVCIVHFRKLSRLKRTIKHIQQHTTIDYQIRILNQGYIDSDIKEYLSLLESHDNISVRYYPENLGPAPARKLLFQSINTEYILSLDDDVYLPSGWFDEIAGFMDANQKIGVVGLSLITPQKSPLPTAKYLDITSKNVLNTKQYVIPPEEYMISNHFYLVDFVSEGAMLLRSRVLDYMQWDEELTVCFEGLDVGLQLKKSEEKVVVYTDKAAVHDSISRKSGFGEYNQFRRNYHEIRKNYLHLMSKWGLRFSLDRHLFYIVFCKILPNPWLRFFSLIWLNRIKPFLKIMMV